MRRSATLVLVSLMFTHSYAQAHFTQPGRWRRETAKPPTWRLPMFRLKAGSIPRSRGWRWPATFRLRSRAASLDADGKCAADRRGPRAASSISELPDSGSGRRANEPNHQGTWRATSRVELRQRDGECNRQAAMDSTTGAAQRSPALRLPTATTLPKPSPTTMGAPTGRERTSTPASPVALALGSFASYARVELQRTAPGLVVPSSADAAIAAADFTPAAAAGPSSGFTRGRVLEAYASYTFHNNQLSFGKQALWWGPSQGGPLLFSNNAAPITMLRYDRVSPIELPGIGRLLGPMRGQFFLGRLSGQQFVHVGSQTLGQPGVALNDQPFINGQKVSFKPSPNLEFSISRTAIFAGAGAPFTTNSFFRSLFSTGNSTPAPTIRAIAGLPLTSNTQFQSSTIC